MLKLDRERFHERPCGNDGTSAVPSFLIDQNFNHDVLNGVLRLGTAFAFRTALECGVDTLADPELLAWAAERGLVVITHDVRTLVPLARARVADRLAMPGVLLIPQSAAVGVAIERLQIGLVCVSEEEWPNQVVFA